MMKNSLASYGVIGVLWALTSSGLAQVPASKVEEASTPPPELCRTSSEAAMAIDFKAAAAQSQNRGTAEQLQLHDEALTLWQKAATQCEGRLKDRALRNVADSQKSRASLSEKKSAGPQCENAHKDAATLQELAKQALSERRFVPAATLFRKAETAWDLAADQCTGTLVDVANQRREQSEIDGYNAQTCAPAFEKAREHTQKLRAAVVVASPTSREEKQDALMVAETLWRDAQAVCKGSVVDAARNNAQAIARERGTPWEAQAASAPPLGNKNAAGAASPASAVKPGAAGTPVASSALVPVLDFNQGAIRFNGQFQQDPGAVTYSGSGRIQWPNGDAYEGTVVNSARQGKGIFVWANGQRYSGDWDKGAPQGQGQLRFVNGNEYDGQVSNGVPQGQGRMQFVSGDTYAGQFEQGQVDRFGVYTWKSGQRFAGGWKNALPHGHGEMSFASGARYVGELDQGEHHGKGVFFWPNGDKYDGLWQQGKKHGKGVFTWQTGERWEGTYADDEQSVSLAEEAPK